MSEESINSPSSGMSLGDIYYVLFRHKWKIVGLSALGLGMALALPFVMPRPFQSEAKIFIRYVLETKSPAQMSGADARVKTPDETGGNIINSEIEILTSLDLAQEVADSIGPDKILGRRAEGTKDRFAAANSVRKNLMVPAPNKSSVIQIIFKHRDPTVVQPVLNELVESYFKKHAEVHRPVVDDFLIQETDQLKSRLMQTENALRAAKTNAGVISLEETKRAHSMEMARIRQEIFAAQAELAQRKAVVQELTKLVNAPTVETNQVVEGTAVVPPEKIADYRRINGLLDSLVARERELSLQFTPENIRLKNIQEQIAISQQIKEKLEKDHPGLLAVAASDRLSTATNVDPRIDLQAEMAAAAALASKIQALTNQLDQVRRESASIDSVEGSITELQRKRELEEANYKYYSAKLEESRIDEALGAGRVSNISVIQAPSPPFRDNLKLIKLMLGTCVGAFVAALAWAFLTELYLDRSVRRPSQIGAQMRIPLFLSIPRLALNGKTRALKTGRKVSLLNAAEPESGANDGSLITKSSRESKPDSGIVTWDSRHPLRPFFETLRDRLIAFFEANNLVHKPKLVALTGCGGGSGVTTTAMGLAASLSETGEGNVLLVDMNLQEGEAHHFHKGRLECGIDDALASDKRQGALVQENLYVVTEGTNGSQLPHHLPKRFKHLVPRLRASDYDYIIFDMPPVNQLSATTRLAQFMDMIFLVVESEKTDRDVVKRAADLLSESKANVGVVLNKTKAYVPHRLQPEI